MRIINRFISTVKGEDFKLDSRVPLSYVILLFLSRGLSLLWGIIRFRSIKKLFIHPSSVMRCTSMIKVGKNFSVGRNCYINALSQEGLILFFVSGLNIIISSSLLRNSGLKWFFKSPMTASSASCLIEPS